VEQRGGFLTWLELTQFELEGQRLPLINQRGIHNPGYLDHTLSITSAVDGPYEDKIGPGGLLHYEFEAGDPLGGANRKLRQAMVHQVPFILFERPIANVYVPIFQAYAIDDDLEAGYFRIAAGDELRTATFAGERALEKSYAQRLVMQRVHQPVFRARVITAYQATCAICRLKHRELLDAAHIIPDSEPGSSAEVTNGMALCKIHHAAYDRNLLGIDSNYQVHLKEKLLFETDGPMLKHGLQDMHGVTLSLPRSKTQFPNPDALGQRFETFLTQQGASKKSRPEFNKQSDVPWCFEGSNI
jgi:putative restriction endonuclease